ncbi:MAG: hypothetical protein JXL20_04020 [Deltaproteobacteria bacterium]|nr:hypothetical protein [Deltaproteobacteria bacterium]
MRGRIVVGLIMLTALFQTQKAFCDGKIVRVVPGYVLIDTDQNIGAIGDVIRVYRATADGHRNIGSVQIVRFKSGRAAAKIVKQGAGFTIKAGDFLEGFGPEDDSIDSLFGDSGTAGRRPAARRNAPRPSASSGIILGPIPGATILPARGRSAAFVQASFLGAKSEYNSEGDLIKYNDDIEDFADPKMSISALSIDLMHAFTEKHAVGISVPMILSQKLNLNVKDEFDDLIDDEAGDGLTGIGDITVWGRMLVQQTQDTRLALDAGFKLATGSTIEDMKDDNLAPTGTGNTGFHLGINGDRFMGNTLTSFAISYVMYSEGEFEMEGVDFKMKHGNELNATARMSLKMSPKMSVGVEAALYKSAEYEVEGKKVDDSESSGFVVAPLVGFQLGNVRNPIHVFGGYALTLSGVNFMKVSGITVGAAVYL